MASSPVFESRSPSHGMGFLQQKGLEGAPLGYEGPLSFSEVRARSSTNWRTSPMGEGAQLRRVSEKSLGNLDDMTYRCIDNGVDLCDHLIRPAK